MAVSEHDRDQMSRIGRYQAESNSKMLAEHLSHSLSDRLERSWRLYLEGSGVATSKRDDSSVADFYDRAHALGLYLNTSSE